jgi:NAD-dependent dihydropyrimidine dehydrogenase PreA subunit
MPGVFIDIEIAADAAKNAELARTLEEVCPVSIFKAGDAGVAIVEDNLDECTLCDLCLEAAPGKIKIIKLYES